MSWTAESIEALYQLPFLLLVDKARAVHKEHFTQDEVELCTLLSIKTGACPEDCAYCPQSGLYNTGVEKETLFKLEEVIARAKLAKENGAKRFCMGAGWRSPPKKELPKVMEMIKAVKALGLETCVTLGMLDEEQARDLKSAGLDFYNHNIDTSPEYYKKIITTRDFGDRLKTLENVRNADIHVCCGGIVGMGETREDRVNFLLALANLSSPPESVPINRLIPIPGTPLEHTPQIENFEFIRTVAIARIMFPRSRVRLSAGRESMSEEMQTLCFMAGANSIHYGEKLLVTKNPDKNVDLKFLEKLGMSTNVSAL